MALKVEEHFLVPKHTILHQEDAEKILQQLGSKLIHLPKIKKNDPAIKSFKAKKGSVVRIERISKTAGESTYYRRVV